MKQVKNALLFIATTMAMPIQASENELYFASNIAAVQYSKSGFDDKASLQMLFATAGYQFNDTFSAQARVGVSLFDDTINVAGYDASFKISHSYGVYLKAGCAASETIYPYVVAGYARNKLKATIVAFDEHQTSNVSDVSLGFGADIKLDNLTLNIEYLSYLDKYTMEVDGISVGFSTQF